jgi:hypothetical protein
MTIKIASTSMFGMGLQGEYGRVQTQNTKFVWFPFTGMPYGPTQPVAGLPLEAGSSIVPRGSYKSGVWGAGQINLIPRMVDDIGYLLLAVMGKDTVRSNKKIGTGVTLDTQTGSYVHEFTFDTLESTLPYFTVRRVLEGVPKLGEVIQDNHVASADFNLPAIGPLTANLNMMGRIPSTLDMYVPDLDSGDPWALASVTYDDERAFALSVDPNSAVWFDGTAFPATGLSFTMNNNLLSPDQARTVGSQTPLDNPVLNRAMTIQATVFIDDGYAFYRDLYAGGHTSGDTTWSTTIKSGDIDFRAYSPRTYTANGDAVQYAFQLVTNDDNVEWAMNAPMPMTPGQPMIMTLTGTVQKTSSSSIPYAYMRFQNTVSSAYAIPASSASASSSVSVSPSASASSSGSASISPSASSSS